jgi:hypothetical protein
MQGHTHTDSMLCCWYMLLLLPKHRLLHLMLTAAQQTWHD